MKKLVFLIIILFTITFIKAQPGLTYPQIQLGPYDVGMTNLTIDDIKLNNILNNGLGFGDFEEGRQDGDLYISMLLPDSSTAIKFDIIVPDDPTLYGIRANDTIPYVAVVCYPTLNTNDRDNYSLPGGDILTRMQPMGEPPIFANPEKKYEFIIYSHGLGGHISNMLPELSGFASRGRIVAALYFGDQRFQAFGPMDYNNAQQFALRPLAVSKLIDHLLAHPDFKDHINPDKIGVYGSSYGGATNISLLGGKFIDFRGTNPYDFTQYSIRTATIDERIVCGAGIVPWFGTSTSPFWGIDNIGVVDIQRPFMALAGEEDWDNDFSHIKDALMKMPGDKYLVKFNGLGHDLGEGAGEDYFSWINMFFEAYLSETDSAFAGLQMISNFMDRSDEIFIPLREPSLPNPILPENQAILDTNFVELEWLPANDVTHFELEISDNSNFSNLIVSEYDYQNFYYHFENIEPNINYYWRLKGINEFGESDWTETMSFNYPQVAIDQEKSVLNYSLSQNFPNPFNPTTMISYQLAINSDVKLEIYNILGEKISTLVSEYQPAGNYQVNFNAADLSSGVYFYKIEAGEFISMKRAILLK